VIRRSANDGVCKPGSTRATFASALAALNGQIFIDVRNLAARMLPVLEDFPVAQVGSTCHVPVTLRRAA